MSRRAWIVIVFFVAGVAGLVVVLRDPHVRKGYGVECPEGTRLDVFKVGDQPEQAACVRPDGGLHGPFVEWNYMTGMLSLVGEYQDGRATGYWTKYFEGRKLLEGQLVDGKREGRWTRYDENGEVWAVALFENDKKVEDIVPPPSGRSDGWFEAPWLRSRGAGVPEDFD
jgi:hypothetical protein